MKTNTITPDMLRGVFAVPPLARRADPHRPLNFDENDRIVRHLAGGGITRFLYGGNALLYHLPLTEYEALLEWLSGQPDDFWMIPSAGPSYGRAIDQAPLLRKHSFPCVMMLPCGDPRDAAGLVQGLRAFAEAAETKLVLYLRAEDNFGPDREAGLDAVARLVDEGLCVAIKYAVVRTDPADDPYLADLLRRVDRDRVISGIGERPVVVHLRDWKLPGFTTGSGCLQPRLSQGILKACGSGAYDRAEALRAAFMPLEDLRDAWNPPRVLHYATALAGVAETGPVLPYLSPLSADQIAVLTPVARALAASPAAREAVST